ncbi:DUF695 domain-containing protein [Flavobacterium sp. NG2]|uniref:DUF695 domain-containing protein n=1 Tax=Flavobacterium sp. NG2 TaxID=3097547 RepID=UPI002A822ECE|nr:DUF695 domain-containing protein [Flavobacterium sp. NG2]WPR70616.1 DUF695 domain-containing protein [Flavobacterium sp. NG2]
MSFLKNIFSKNGDEINSYADFWKWFEANEKTFYNVVKKGTTIEKDFFNTLTPKLDALHEGYFFLTGMCDEKTAELVITAEGIVKNIVFVEELVQAAPQLPNWKFTALKSELDIENIQIIMGGYEFKSENLSFYAIEHKNYPDEVDIVIVYDDYNEQDKSIIINGAFIFLDNFLGELNSVTTIDSLAVIAREEAKEDLIPIAKLKDYLIWREKEFVEKYNDYRYSTENDSFSSLEAELTNGKPLIAIVNTSLLDWENKASHPWIMRVIIPFNGESNNGMPNEETYLLLNQIEEDIMKDLKDADGYLNVGRQTADGVREIYFACKDFRKSSKVLSVLIAKYKEQIKIEYDLFKDKYWQCLEKFKPGY